MNETFNLNRIIPFGLSLCGAGLLFMYHEWHWGTAASASGLLVLGVLAGWKLSSDHDRAVAAALQDREAQDLKARDAAIEQVSANLQKLASQVISVWGKQIESSRKKMEDAFVGLTVRFAEIVQRLHDQTGGRYSTPAR